MPFNRLFLPLKWVRRGWPNGLGSEHRNTFGSLVADTLEMSSPSWKAVLCVNTRSYFLLLLLFSHTLSVAKVLRLCSARLRPQNTTTESVVEIDKHACYYFFYGCCWFCGGGSAKSQKFASLLFYSYYHRRLLFYLSLSLSAKLRLLLLMPVNFSTAGLTIPVTPSDRCGHWGDNTDYSTTAHH